LPTDTPRFLAIETVPDAPINSGLSNTQDPSEHEESEVEDQTSRKRMRKLKHFLALRRFLKGKDIVENALEEIKEKATRYALKNDKLWNLTLNTPVVFTAEELKEVVKAVHKDLGHYGKKPTLEAVRKRYDVARELWKEGKKVLK